MKTPPIILIIWVLMAGIALAQAPITSDDLVRRGVTGKIGVALGEIVEIEATIVSGRTTADWTEPVLREAYFLRVHKVRGKVVESPLLMRFVSQSKKIAANTSALHEMKGEGKGLLTPELLRKLEADYVGATFRLLVVEAGIFAGNPTNLADAEKANAPGKEPYDEPVTFWQDYWGRFGFHPYLSVLQVLEKKKEPSAP